MTYRALHHLVPDPESFRSAPPATAAVWQLPPDPLAALLSLSDVDTLLDRGTLRHRMVTVVSAGQRIPAARYTWASRPIQPGFNDVVRAGDIAELLGQGATVVLESLHRVWGPIGEVSRRLSHDVGLPVGANAYLTPAGSQGFAHHYDTHSVLIVQTHGSKTWQVHEPVFADPLEHHWWRPERVGEQDWQRLRHGTPAVETVLHPGDVLWIPRGWIHNGFATDDSSLHVTFGFPTFTPYWIATELVKQLDTVPELRQELPWGLARGGEGIRAALADVVKQLVRVLPEVDQGALAGSLTETLRSYHLEPARSPVTSVLAPRIGPETAVVTVPEAVCGSDWLAGGELRLHLGDGPVTLDPAAARAFAPHWQDDPVRPWRAADLVGELDLAAATELVTRLARQGVLRRA